jgi:GTPase SAR1 family protein
MLPQEKSKKATNLTDYIIFVYGQPGIGKSTFCSNFEHAIFLATEPGLKSLEVFSAQIKCWEDLLNIGTELLTTKHNFKTVVIDTIDNAHSLCAQYIAKKHHADHIADMPMGKGFGLVTEELYRVILKLSNSFGIIMTSHVQSKEIETRTGKYNKIVPALSETPRNKLLGLADIALYLCSTISGDKEERIMHSNPSKFYEAKDKTDKLSDPMPLNYQAFYDAMTKKE